MTQKLRLSGKTAIVTGASKGIGKGIAKLFSEEGAQLIITGRNAKALDDLASSLPTTAIPVVADMCVFSDIQKISNIAIQHFGKIDILCQNAGIYPRALIQDMTEAQWDEVCDTNLKGTFLMIKTCLPHMTQQAYGRIVVISSVTGPKVSQPGFAHYAASKSGVNGLIKTAAMEFAKLGITVNGIEPGMIATEGVDEYPSEVLSALEKGIPLGKFGSVEDIGYAALFLASDEAKYITGETLVVDGGLVLPESAYLIE